MKVGTLLLVFHDVIENLVALDVLDKDGNLYSTALDSLQEDFRLVSMIEMSLKNHGVTVQENIDKVINALPLVLSLIK